jgi:hypothetical protein
MIISAIEQAFDEGQGILRLVPAWVPRFFCRPGRRLKLHPDDYYSLGLERGAIDERWFASTTPADNGPGTPEDEGLSYVSAGKGVRFLLAEAVDVLKGDLIGGGLWNKYHKWPMFSKFFDNLGPLPHHIHYNDAVAANVGKMGKPEMYFFPAQMNNYGGEFPFTFFGLTPETTKGQVKTALENFTRGDNNLLSLSRAYKLEPDTGWDIPAGVLHAPGSFCTYEPQFSSDVFAMFQSVLYYDHPVSPDLLWKDSPPEKRGDYEYLVNALDWELNTDPDFRQNRFMVPIPAAPIEETEKEGYRDEWICYKCPLVSAKRLTILPGKTVTIKDSEAYGIICIQGYGKIGVWNLESPSMIRFNQLTNDEYFISEDTAKKGVVIENRSGSEDIVILKHFAGKSRIGI